MSLYHRKLNVVEAIKLPSSEKWDVKPFLIWATQNGLTEFEISNSGVRICSSYFACPLDYVVKKSDGEFITEESEFFENVFQCQYEKPRQTDVSLNTTLKLIEESDKQNGMHANDVVKVYRKMGILTYNKNILRQFKHLVEKGCIYCTNPDAERGKRYRVLLND